MNKNIFKIFVITALITVPAMAEEANPPFMPPRPPMNGERIQPKKPTPKEIKQMDKMIAERLSLTDEQLKVLKGDRQKNMKELEKIINKMEKNHKKIRDIYLLGLPPYQADIKSAPYKMELVLLKQNADKIRNQNRKNFEAILTPEQKAEFKKFRSEMAKRPPRPPKQ